MRIDLDKQRATYDEFADEAARQLIGMLEKRIPHLVDLGRSRAFEDVGLYEYGDATYWHDDDRLQDEVDAELADAIFYLQILVARQAGALPSPSNDTPGPA